MPAILKTPSVQLDKVTLLSTELCNKVVKASTISAMGQGTELCIEVVSFPKHPLIRKASVVYRI
jgi:hypothetical protein